MSSSSKWSHLKGRKHLQQVRQNRAQDPNPTAAMPPPIVETKSSDPSFCPACDRRIPLAARASHFTDRNHLRKERYLKYKLAEEHLEKNKGGVEVGRVGGVDFGTLDMESPMKASMEIELEITVLDGGQIDWGKVRLSAAAVRAGFTSSAQPESINSRDYRLSIYFQTTPYAGVYEGRLELSFTRRASSSSKPFVISRPLVCRVGSLTDYEDLKPIAPYKPIRREDIDLREQEDVVPGQPPEAIAEIKWSKSRKLKKFEVPKYMVDFVEEEDAKRKIAGMMAAVGALSAKTVGTFWKMVLWLEEVQMMRDIRRYDMSEATLTASRQNYLLSVPGLAEKRPSVLIGDTIRVRPTKDSGRWFEGYVHTVELSQVGLRFDSRFQPIKNTKFDVRFTVSRLPMRRMHQAMDVAIEGSISSHLFPASLPWSMPFLEDEDIEEFQTFDRKMANNKAQKTAVLSILENTDNAFPIKIIFGPFGTGKTSTMVEAARQLLKRKSAKLLLCAPSNAASDILAERLALHLNKSEILRLNAPSRVDLGIPEVVRSISRKANGFFCVPPIAELENFRVVVCTLCSASVLYGIGLKAGHFSHIMVDEAGQGLEPECLIPITEFYQPGRVQIVLAGDPQQLGPIIRSKHAGDYGLGRSLLERLMSQETFDYTRFNGKTVVKLIQNYRNHSSILKFPNERFYASELVECADPTVTQSLLRFSDIPKPNSQFPVIFHSVKGKDEREASSPSFFNIPEVTLVKKYASALLEDKKLRLLPEQIGVISPYHGQVQKIRKSFAGKGELKKIKVGSTEEFQGQERRAIIISTVRSNAEYLKEDKMFSLGFLSNPKRFNVAITRAQALLVIIGDPNVLSLDPLWKGFLSYIYNNGGWTGRPDPEWDVNEDGVEEVGSFEFGEMERAIKMLEDEDADEEASAQRPWNREE
ncbi:P-loop containing nucleoside triphosphate hydrolase protein [Atractiella rhizophila]|nr:P-loop containing nucleoside triphosphate hydrolase protein [Atractiella rhizophila]